MVVIVKKIINIFFFGVAFIVLILGPFGVLTMPGLFVAIIASYFILKEHYILAATLGVFAATGSYTAQAFSTFCPYCTVSASSFAIGGIISLILNKERYLIITSGLIVVLLIGLFSLNSMFYHYQNPTILADVRVTNNEQTDKPLFYISPSCGSCKSYLDELIKVDPEGLKWQVVTIPIRSLAQSEAMLREKGYKGSIIAAPSSPTNFVPVLIDGEEIYRGQEINNILRRK